MQYLTENVVQYVDSNLKMSPDFRVHVQAAGHLIVDTRNIIMNRGSDDNERNRN